MDAAVYILTALGLFFNLMSIVGLFRFPDVFTRLHAATKTTTLGAIFIVAAAVVHSIAVADDNSLTLGVHALLALATVLFTNPVGAHAIARAAYRQGARPRHLGLDELKIADRETEAQ